MAVDGAFAAVSGIDTASDAHTVAVDEGAIVADVARVAHDAHVSGVVIGADSAADVRGVALPCAPCIRAVVQTRV